ncbi:hypothetical protein NCAS_0I00410 [Naumovozyma castellii]|uniref:LDB19 N-terminal domain-containing protein n=1 Tax=Naumovozyma castellii TaxID=27288 RepID=G0VJM9_NAUCA|nr:hypothetical protein NCAS_0I00410 [Naumovozyma castellii CBS 4309]CCC71709.1 hypothetical protein NCAS_0I00410 [Naumovozyma castellii CBS 4309]
MLPFAKLAQSSSIKSLNPSKNVATEHPIELSINVESPPCVLYGSAADSTGSLLSGVVTLNVKDPYADVSIPTYDSIKPSKSAPQKSPRPGRRKSAIGSTLSTTFSQLAVAQSQATASSQKTTPSPSPSNTKIMNGYTKISVTSVSLTFVQKIHFHKPFTPDTSSIQSCTNCRTKLTDMKSWPIQKAPQDKPVGAHTYPFSYLIPGSVPSTSYLGSNAETQIKYELIAVATYKEPTRRHDVKSKEKMLRLVMPVAVTRSIPRGPDKNSLRVFPPTELTAAAVLPNVIYPKSTFPLEMKLDGVSLQDRRWRMRKLSWRVEETTRVRSYACKVHQHELRKLEKHVKEREIERNKKPMQQIKRYGDIGPQVRVAVSSPENLPLQRLRNHGDLNSNSSRNNPSMRTPQDGSASSGNGHNGSNDIPEDRDDQDDVSVDEFIHPSDDALRQELLQQQQRLREQQLQQEIAKNDSTLFTEEVRIIAKGDMKSGWKTDFENNGKIELVTEIDCMPLNSGVGNPVTMVSTSKPHINSHKQDANISCDIQDPNLGIYVNHILAVEIVVAEETLQYSNGQPIRSKSRSDKSKNSSNSGSSADQRLAELSPMFANRNAPRTRPVSNNSITPVNSRTTNGETSSGNNDENNSENAGLPINSSKVVSVPTGAARVLRMQFRLNVTERSGLGISWDEEVPPIYQDVMAYGPPSYQDSTVSLRMGSITDQSEVGYLGGTDTGNNSVDSVTKLTRPTMAHYVDRNNSISGSSNSNGLNTVVSPPLENIISIQGNVPLLNQSNSSTQILTPNNTREVRMHSVSQVLDTDRITQ